MSDRLSTLRERMQAWQLDGLLLSTREFVAWLTQGATYHVVERSEVGVASLLVTAERVHLVAPENEIDRLTQEEAQPFEITPVIHAWHETPEMAITRLGIDTASMRIGSDWPLTGTIPVGEQLLPLRFELDSLERERITGLGQETARIVEQVARTLKQGEREIDIEARLLHDCLAAEIRPVCTLVAFDERIDRYPHPIPTAAKLSNRALLTLGAERHGLNVSLTRMVRFDKVEAALWERYRHAAAIHADTLSAVRPGIGWSSLFEEIAAAYARHGYPRQWQRHHQGGPAGYGCRDMILTPKSEGRAVTHQVFAFNPTLSGVKSEETLLLDEGGGSMITRTGDWPTLDFTVGDTVWSLADWLARN